MGTYTTTGTKAVWGYDTSGNRVIVDNIPVTTTYSSNNGNTVVTQNLATGEVIKSELVTYAGSSQVGSVSGGGIVEQKTETVQVPNYVQMGNEIIQARSQPTISPVTTPNPINQYFKYSFVGGTNTGQVYLRPENMQTPPPPEKVTITTVFSRGVNTIFGGKETKNVGYSEIEYQTNRQTLLTNLKGTEGRPMDLLTLGAPLPMYVYGKLSGNEVDLSKPYRVIGEGVSYGFYPKENIGLAYESVYQSYISRNYSSEVAYYKTQITSERFMRDVRGEFAFDVGVGIVSNAVGGVLVQSSKQLIPLAFKGLSPKAIYYGSRTFGMGTAGVIEANSFMQGRSSFTTKAPLGVTDYLMATGIGAVSSIGAQVFIETGFRGVLNPTTFGIVNAPKTRVYTNVLKKGTTVGGAGVRESALKFIDPLEEASDSATTLLGVPFKNVRTFPFSTNARTQPSVEQPSMGRSVTSGYVGTPTVSYQFTQTNQQTRAPKRFNVVTSLTETMPLNAKVRAQTGTLPAEFTNPRTQPNTLPEVFNRVTTKNQVVPFTQPLTNPRTQPNVFPNVLPQTRTQPQVLPNVFATDFAPVPFIPPMGGGYGKDFGFNIRTKQKKAYVPSLTAIGLGIKSKRGRKTETFSGISLRPLRS